MRAKAQSYINALSSYGLLDLTIVSLLTMGATGMLAPVLPLHLKATGISPEQIGFIYTSFQIALATGEISWGSLTDRIGMKIPLVIGMALAGISVAGLSATGSIAAIYIFNIGRALGTSALFPIGRGHIGATVPVNRRATIMAVYMTVQASGRTLGSFLSGFLGSQSLVLALRVSAGMLLAASLTAAFLFQKAAPARIEVPLPIKPADDPKPRRISKSQVANVITVGSIITFYHASIGSRSAFLSLHAVSAANMSVTQVGFLFTLMSMVGLFFTIPLGRLADRLGWHKAMTIGLLALAASMAGFAYASTFFLFILAGIFIGLSSGIFRPAANARFSQTMSQRRQATAMGVLGVFEDTGNMIGPAVGGVLWESRLGPPAAFLVGTVGGILGALCNLIFLRKKPASNPVA
ncbi:MAG: MFS transporter [Chloroflexota bacterium]